jgi:hypothetical protein
MISKVTKYSTVLAVSLLAVVLAGCGAGNREGTNTLGGSALFGNVATVGDTPCIQCHSAVADSLTGETIVAQYQQNSPHDQQGLGCESCHGGGAMHNGVGPIPYSSPDANRCATCHTGTTGVAFKNSFGNMTTIAPLATNSNTEFTTSNHAKGTPSHTSGLCIRCHTHEGAVLSNKSGFTGDSNVLGNGAYGPPVVTSGYSAFTCDTCHQHGGGLRGVSGRDNSGNLVLWNPDKSNKTDQFNLCTSCHNLYNYNQTAVIASGTAASGTLNFEHNTRWNRTLVTTHKEKGMATLLKLPFANMTSAADSSNTWITGYAIRMTKPATLISGVTYNTDPSYKGPCFDCHGHEAKTNTNNTTNDPTQATIHTDWGRSGHAGGLLNAKYTAAVANAKNAAEVDAVTAAYVDANTNSWSHYNWDSTLKADGTDDRGACQKCHTATGVSNYLNSPSTYDQLKNNFTHLLGWNQKGGSKRQNELLYCWGCHKDAGTGKLRNPGAITTTEYTYNSAAITFSDVSSSNTCVVCHSGRGNSDTIAATAAASRSTRNAAHHAPAAATLFSAASHVGYEFPGASYANQSYFQHDKIGTSAAEAATGTSGPCVACHMGPSSSDGKPSHTLAVLSADGSAINNQALCNKCHTSHPMSVAVLTTEKAGATNATLLLSDILKQANGQTNYQLTDMTASAFFKGATATVGDYGAFQNSLYNGTDVGAYAHNRYYLKRLIFDSIDWAKNGQLTGSITIPAGYTDAATWFKADATTGVAARP